MQIGDFGLSKRIQSDSGAHGHSKAGTSGYMPPEMHGLHPPSRFPGIGANPMAGDIWSFGEIVHQLLTKCHTFKDNTALGHYVQDPALFPLKMLRHYNVSKDGVEFIQSCMAARPSARQQAVAALGHEWLKDVVPYRVESVWPHNATRLVLLEFLV